MGEFTKGPWKTAPSENCGNVYVVADAMPGRSVALCSTEADARLIAAAPTLLAACEAFAKAFRAYELDNGDSTPAHREMMKRGIAAIAAARGEAT